MPLVVIDPVTHCRIALYAKANNISVDLAIIEVVSDWLDEREDLGQAGTVVANENGTNAKMTNA